MRRVALALCLVVFGCADPPKSPPPAAPEGVAVGNRAPDFSLQDDAGTTVKLSSHADQRPVVLAFYPKDFTGG